MPLSFKPFDQMTEADYRNIGLKVGLEVHQQLLTRRLPGCARTTRRACRSTSCTNHS